MAIIKCPECRREVSSKAPVCPYCGIVINDEVYHEKTASNDEKEVESGEEPSLNQSGQQEKQKTQKSNSYKWAIIIILILLAAVGATVLYYHYIQHKQDEAKFERIMESEDPDAMQEYLDLHPDVSAEQRKVLEGRINRAMQVKNDWNEACGQETVTAFKAFLRKYPTNIYAEEAYIKIDSLDFLTAKKSNSIESYKAYLEQHRDGIYYDIASDMVNRMEKSSVSDDEMKYIRQAFKNYFDNLKEDNAAESEFDDVISVKYNINNDYKITKIPELNGNDTYKATFTVSKQVNRAGDEMETVKTYRVKGALNSNGNVENVNMEEINGMGNANTEENVE